jgi:hypothetical protein
MCAGPATSVCLFVCNAVRLTAERSGQQMWGIGCLRSMRRVAPYALVGIPAKFMMSTAAVMCRLTVGSLSRVKFDWGGSTDRHGEADMRFLSLANFCCERTGTVSMCIRFDVRTFRFAYISMRAHFDLLAFRCAYISICIHFDVSTFRIAYFLMSVHFDLRTFRLSTFRFA